MYVEPLSKNDLMFIASTMYPSIPQEVLSYMVMFNMRVSVTHLSSTGRGGRGVEGWTPDCVVGGSNPHRH